MPPKLPKNLVLCAVSTPLMPWLLGLASLGDHDQDKCLPNVYLGELIAAMPKPYFSRMKMLIGVPLKFQFSRMRFSRKRR